MILHDHMSPCETFAIELEALRMGRASIEDLWSRYNDPTNPEAKEFRTILAFVEHYVADDDIRAKDAGYSSMQENEFDRLLDLLRRGQLEEAQAITFLRSTG